jgi:hypothetical protein
VCSIRALPFKDSRGDVQNMDPAKYEYQSEFARRYFSQGKAEGEAMGKAEGKAGGKAVGAGIACSLELSWQSG